ncbi:MAG: DNA primase [Coriobacteriia bacterium]|nr:DNA primase [Coriobacteriia bacterium]
MGRISAEDIQRVREATDLVALVSERTVLRQKGRLFWGLCPFHGEKTSSFKVDPATQLWHCFGCGKGGDAFGFVIESDNVDFPDAVRLLASRAHIEIAEQSGPGDIPHGRKERLMAACEEAAAYYARVLTGSRKDHAEAARRYLADRGFGSEVARAWRLGYAPGRGELVSTLAKAGFTEGEMIQANLAMRGDNQVLRDRFFERIMFPIADLQGRTVAFGGRVLGDGVPKYLNTSDTPVFKKSVSLYAIDRAKAAITSSGVAIVVEGYTDVIGLHTHGITNAVATLGTALTTQHVKLLGRFAREVVYLFDGDEAGMRAADRAVEFVDTYSTEMHDRYRVNLSAAVMPDGMDPADYVNAKGAEAVSSLVASAVPLLQFAIDRRLARWDLDRPEERARALRDAAEVLAPVKGSILAADYANYISDKLLADAAAVRNAISSVSPSGARGREVRSRGDDRGAVGLPTQAGGTAPTDGTAQADLTPMGSQARVELETLGMLAAHPRLRETARDLLKLELFSDERNRSIARVLMDAGSKAGAAEVNGLLFAHVPGAVEMLAASKLADCASVASDEVFVSLTRRLKEFALERRIAVGKAKLKHSGKLVSSAEYDDVFREVSLLQRELDVLRRGEDSEKDNQEARGQRDT